jgi:hypothetical protein
MAHTHTGREGGLPKLFLNEKFEIEKRKKRRIRERKKEREKNNVIIRVRIYF